MRGVFSETFQEVASDHKQKRKNNINKELFLPFWVYLCKTISKFFNDDFIIRTQSVLFLGDKLLK